MILDAPFVVRPVFVMKIWQKVFLFLLSAGYYFMGEAVLEQWDRAEFSHLGILCCFCLDHPYIYFVRPYLLLAIWFGMALAAAIVYKNRAWPKSMSNRVLLLTPFLLWLLDELLMNYLY